jgi:hypothetical protein
MAPVSWSGGSRPWGGAGAQQRMDAAVTASAQLLGMSKSDLQSSLSGGQSLSDIASAKGVSNATLVSTIQKAISQVAPSGGTPPSGDMATRIAGRIAGHHHHHKGAAAGASAVASSGASTASGSSSSSSDPDGDGDNDSGKGGLRAYL